MYRLMLILLALSAATAVCAAEVYKTVDEQGRVIYTDKPPQGQSAEKVDLPPLNTTPRVAVPSRSPDRDRRQSTVPGSYAVRFVSPAPESHVNPGERNLTVQATTQPPLHSRHRIVLTDNGAEIPSNGQGGALIENIIRGTHSLQALVVDENGTIISRSEAIRVYVHRPTVRAP